MGNENGTMPNKLEELYMELMETIDEMDGDDKRQVEESKAELKALVGEAFDVNFM